MYTSIFKLLKNLILPSFLRLCIDDEDGGGANDVQRADNGDVIGTGGDARLKMYNDIADNADRVRADEFSDLNDDGTTSKFTVTEDEDPEAKAAREDAEAEEARKAAEEAAKQEQVTDTPTPAPLPKIKVAGQDVDLTPELITKAQKIAAADKYLAEASALRQAAAKQATDAASASKQNEVDQDLASEARAIQMGSEEEALGALKKVIQTVTPSFNEDEITLRIEDRLTAKYAFQQFEKDYNDIMSDPKLRQIVMNRDTELIKSGDRRPYQERYAAIGEEVRGWIGGFKGNQTQAQTEQPQQSKETQNKQERKANAPAPVKAANGKTQTSVQEEQEESASETIANMAKARGGPQWMMGGR